jgi:hypothetical protein
MAEIAKDLLPFFKETRVDSDMQFTLSHLHKKGYFKVRKADTGGKWIGSYQGILSFRLPNVWVLVSDEKIRVGLKRKQVSLIHYLSNHLVGQSESLLIFSYFERAFGLTMALRPVVGGDDILTLSLDLDGGFTVDSNEDE